MQVGILSRISGPDHVVRRVLEVVEVARASGVRTFFLRHVTLPTELMGVSQLRMWRSWQRVERASEIVSPFPPTAPQSQLIPELRPTDREALVDKVTMSAFEGTWLDIVLRDCGITTVAVVGVAMEVGIEPTVRHAADLGYIPVIVTDACGTGNAEAAERSLAALQFSGDAMLTTAEQLRTILTRSGELGTA